MTREQSLREGRRRLAEAGIDNPALDARLLLLYALRLDAMELVRAPEHPVDDRERLAFDALIARRIEGEPVARISGAKEFFGLPFMLAPATLVPRPETELIIEEALRIAGDRGARIDILDLGTGSGCILLSILHERPHASGVGVDRAIGAARMARENAAALGLAERARFLVGDWAASIDSRFDLVVANPPYIPTGDIAGLAPEVVAHDPGLALDGGPDGLDAYRTVLADLPRLLKPGGTALLEIGHDQAGAVVRLAAAAGLPGARVAADLAGHDRAIILNP